MPNLINSGRTFFFGRQTQTAGTIIAWLINAANRLKTKVQRAKVTCAGTAHTLTFLRPLGSKYSYRKAQELAGYPIVSGPEGGRIANAFVMAAVAAGGTSYVLSRDPGNYSANFTNDGRGGPLAANNLIASGDLLAIETAAPGVYFLATVSGTPSTSTAAQTAGQCTVTATAAPTGGVPVGASVFFFGITTDTDPRTGAAHPSYLLTASVQNDVYNGESGVICETLEPGEPILAYDNNATAAGSIDQLSGGYGP